LNIKVIHAIWGCCALLVLMGVNVAADPISVFVSIMPQRYFVQQIGENLVSVQVMVQPGASPATYEPKPVQMVAIAKAKAYFSIGVPFENAWLEKIAATNPGMRVVATDQGIQKLTMPRHHHDHDSGPKKHKSRNHGSEDDIGNSFDPHIWTSPRLVMKQAHTIVIALQQIDPAHHSEYEANYQQFLKELSQLDRELKNNLAGLQNRRFMVFHPSWGYFAHTYGLTQVPVEIEGKHPKPSQMQALIEHARHQGIKVIFVQPQFSTKSAQMVAAAIGGKIVFADPLAENWAANLRQQANQLKAAMR
jgi:zinc transport system substrate-binding protein